MKFDINSLLRDKNVLYIVAFLAATNVLSYLMAGNYESIVFFGVVGYLATYYSKNMIVILLISMLTTNLLLGTRMLKRNVEAMANNDKPKEKKNEEEENSTEEMSNEKANKKVKEKMQPNIDYAATLEQAYDNLDNLIGQDGIKKMGEQTERLATKQKELMQNIEAMAPMLQKAGSMLKAMPLEGLGNLQTNVTDALNKLSGKTGGNK
jgi:small-conductance mechanosensitive channel